MHPVAFYDSLTFERKGATIAFSCDAADVPADASNLVCRAAELFRQRANIKDGIRIHLEKKVPVGGGLGGGSANAAVTLTALNELFGKPLDDLHDLAAQLGSDVPFFLQPRPALATGRGEKIQPLDFFPALRDKWFLLIHPGFGVSTPWAYKHLEPPYGKPGRAEALIETLQGANLKTADFYNSLEIPVLRKYPLLQLFQEFVKASGALTALMSGSGSTTFAICAGESQARELEQKIQQKFGPVWAAAVPVQA